MAPDVARPTGDENRPSHAQRPAVVERDAGPEEPHRLSSNSSSTPPASPFALQQLGKESLDLPSEYKQSRAWVNFPLPRRCQIWTGSKRLSTTNLLGKAHTGRICHALK